MTTLRIFKHVLQGILQTKPVQRQGPELGHQLMDFVVNGIGTFDDHASRACNLFVHVFGPMSNRHAHAFDGCDLLTQFVVQFARNLPSHFFNACLNDLG